MRYKQEARIRKIEEAQAMKAMKAENTARQEVNEMKVAVQNAERTEDAEVR